MSRAGYKLRLILLRKTNVPQRLKPSSLVFAYGTAEAMPLSKTRVNARCSRAEQQSGCASSLLAKKAGADQLRLDCDSLFEAEADERGVE